MNTLWKLPAALTAFCFAAAIHAAPVLAQTIPFYAEGFGTYNPADGTYVAPCVGTLLGRYDNFRAVQVTPTDDPFVFSDTQWKFTWTLTGKVDLGGPNKVVRRPLKIIGAGAVSELPSVDTPWDTQGNASGRGRYTSPPVDSAEANRVSVDFDSRFSPLEGHVPFSGTSTFIAADGSELSLDFEGFISILPNGELRWIADFTPAVEKCSGRFSEVESGSIVMLASSPP